MTTILTLICAAHDGSGGFPADRPAAPRLLDRAGGIAPPIGARLFVAPGRAALDTAAAAGWRAEVAPELAEADVGEWAGRAVDEIDPKALANWTRDPHAAPPGGDSFAQAAARVAGWLDAQAGRGGRAAAIAPAGAIRAAIIAAVDAPLTLAPRIDIPALSTVRLTHDGRRWAWRAGA